MSISPNFIFCDSDVSVSNPFNGSDRGGGMAALEEKSIALATSPNGCSSLSYDDSVRINFILT